MNQKDLQKVTSVEIKNSQPLSDARLEKEYNTYLITNNNHQKFILKQVSENEVTMNNLLSKNTPTIILKVIDHIKDQKGHHWLTIDYVSGSDYIILTRELALKLGRTLAELTVYYMEHIDLLDKLSPSIETQIIAKESVLNKIPKQSLLYNLYEYYIKRFVAMPKSICHDDLLPINVIYDEQNHIPKLIDWEYGRKSSYLTDISRLTIFYSEDKTLFDKGFSFFGEQSLVTILIEEYMHFLSLDSRLVKKQLMLDYQLECMNQLLLNVSHLEHICRESARTDWEMYFFNQVEKKAQGIKRLMEKNSL